MSKNNGKEYVDTGKGLGYYASTDVYENDEKIGSKVYKTDFSGRTYADEYDENGKKIGSHYTD